MPYDYPTKSNWVASRSLHLFYLFYQFYLFYLLLEV